MKEQSLLTLTIFYDGKCPLCLAEIHVLKNNNHRQLLTFVDLHDAYAVNQQVNCALAMEIIHAKLGDDTIITGASVFAEAYKRADVKVMKWLFSFALFETIYSVFYMKFARYRHHISKWIGPSLLRLANRRYPPKI